MDAVRWFPVCFQNMYGAQLKCLEIGEYGKFRYLLSVHSNSPPGFLFAHLLGTGFSVQEERRGRKTAQEIRAVSVLYDVTSQFCQHSFAFHRVRVLQGRLPIRVQLKGLTEADLYRILTEPKNNLIRQQVELMKTEGVSCDFFFDIVKHLSRFKKTTIGIICETCRMIVRFVCLLAIDKARHAFLYSRVCLWLARLFACEKRFIPPQKA